MKSPSITSQSHHGHDPGKPPKEDFLLRTPEQLVSFVGDRGSFGFGELPLRFSIDELGTEIAAIGLDGAESLSPIAAPGGPSPSSLPRDEGRGMREEELQRANSPKKEEAVDNVPEEKLRTKEDPFGGGDISPTNTNEGDKAETSHTISPSRSREESHLQSDSKSGEESHVQSDDIEAAQNLAGVSSRVFIEQIRGAAFRRKMDLARSRDSLVAKEKEHREAHAASRLAGVEIQEYGSERDVPQSVRHSSRTRPHPLSARPTGAAGVPIIQKRPSTVPISPHLGRRRETHNGVPERGPQQPVQEARTKAFKARPFPKTACSEAKGGLRGVQMVPKKPPTIAISPKLGVRKPLADKDENTKSMKDEDDQTVFKARQLPKSTGNSGDGGLVGVPKVQKRQVTTPVSPLLGARRPKPEPDNLKSECDSVQGSSYLIGIDFIKSPIHGNAQSTSSPQPAVTPQQRDRAVGEFIPHSTLRAQKRAVFDAARREHELEREEEQSRQLKGQVRALQKELCVLRDQI